MESVINILPEFVANQIAAGEVVNRPASAVKELLENAVDAGSTDIGLHVQDGGRTLIQVVDNGCGMSEDDARRCFLPHATSKLSSAEDLQHIRTLGFRGEALASIAAVAQVELQTRPKTDEVGTRVSNDGGQIRSVESCACPEGTCIKVKNLYFNTPARRQFLKSDEVEYRYVEEEFNRVALARPEIRFSLYRNGQKICLLENGNLKRRIVQLMGKAFESRLVKVSENIPGLELRGYICTPEYVVKGRSKQFLFVNRRFIRHSGLSNAVEKAYQGLIPEGKSPAFFLHLEVEAGSIDVNVHPTKTEIRFKDERLLYGVLLSACKYALGVNQMRNVLDFESPEALPYRYRPQNYVPDMPRTGLHPGYDPFSNPRPDASSPDSKSGFPDSHVRIGDLEIRKTGSVYRAAYGESFARMQQNPGFGKLPTQLELDCCREIAADTRLEFQTNENLQQQTENEDSGRQEKNRNSRIFQIFDRYIICPLKSGLAVIHQEAASERIIYNDYISKKTKGNLPSQSTLFPQTVEFSNTNAEILRDIREPLNTLGWGIEWIGGNSFMVNAFPVGIQESRVQEILESILDSYASRLLKSPNGMQENLAAATARELAVKQGTPLSQEEVLYLATRLFSGPDPEISPSGRKTLWILPEKALDQWFNEPFAPQ